MFSASAPSHGRKLSIVIMYNGGHAAGLLGWPIHRHNVDRHMHRKLDTNIDMT